MKDFAKSIVCDVKAEVAKVGNYNPKDYENDPRHKWTIKSIENEIQIYKQRIELNRVRITQLRNMENSGNYPSSSRELKEEQKDYEANQMKVKQLVSMLRRATGNELPEDMVENSKVGNFEDPKKAKYYIEMWERRRDDAKRSLQNAEGHLKEAMKHRYGDKEFNQREVQRYKEAIKAAEASIKQYDDLIKAAAKSSFGNSKVGNAFQEKALQYAYEKAKSKGLSGKALEDETLRIAIHVAPYDSLAHSDSLRREVQEFLLKVGNSKVGNGITKFGLGSYVIADGHKAIVLGETVERGPNGIPFGWVTIRWVEGPWKGQSDQQYDYDLKKA